MVNASHEFNSVVYQHTGQFVFLLVDSLHFQWVAVLLPTAAISMNGMASGHHQKENVMVQYLLLISIVLENVEYSIIILS